MTQYPRSPKRFFTTRNHRPPASWCSEFKRFHQQRNATDACIVHSPGKGIFEKRRRFCGKNNFIFFSIIFICFALRIATLIIRERSPASASSRTMFSSLSSMKDAWYLITLGWFNCCWRGRKKTHTRHHVNVVKPRSRLVEKGATEPTLIGQ